MKKYLLLLFFLALSLPLHAEEKKTPSPAQAAHQQRMKACNAEAKEKSLKGEERKSFMSTCLKNKG
jgi:hypothetical protein